MVAGDPYDIVLYEPAAAEFLGATAEGARVVSTAKVGAVRTVRLSSGTSGRVAWRVAYRTPTSRPRR